MNVWVATGGAAGFICFITVIELLALVFVWKRARRFAASVVAGGCLAGAWAVSGSSWVAAGGLLACAGVAHGVDVVRRW